MVTVTQSGLDMLNAGNTQSKPKRHKYNAKKTVVDGHSFDSRKEADRYLKLKLQEHCGFISGLELQPEFTLQAGFVLNGKRIRPIKYRADFKYQKDGETVIEDVKGKKTKEYIIKKKIFLKLYPEYRFLES